MLLGGALVGPLAWSVDASACHDQDGVARNTVCFTSLHAALATLIFGPADIAYAAERGWLPPEWAWPQLWLGGIATVAGGATGLGLAIDDSPDPALDITWASSMIFVGGFHGSVALFSLEKDRPGQDAHQGDEETLLRVERLLLAPTGEGLVLSGTF